MVPSTGRGTEIQQGSHGKSGVGHRGSCRYIACQGNEGTDTGTTGHGPGNDKGLFYFRHSYILCQGPSSDGRGHTASPVRAAAGASAGPAAARRAAVTRPGIRPGPAAAMNMC
eukprot:768797-Hanusia_phi.AAC.3